MKLSVIALIKLGYKYLQLWPNRAELSQYFQEYSTVQFARLVINWSPGLALFSFLIAYGLQADAGITTGLFYFIFLVSLPVQALVILGVQADKVLPPSLAAWYKEGVARYKQQGGEIKLSLHKPRYLDLAKLLNMTYQSALK
ncbi:terminus macrodomain insulation protein YfbV [Colwellia sp. MEBiC06753]